MQRAMGWLKRSRQIVPEIAIAPLFIIWFGFGFTPKLLLVFLLSFFPIVVSGIAGFKSLDPDVAVGTSYGGRAWSCRVFVRRAGLQARRYALPHPPDLIRSFDSAPNRCA